MNLSEYHKIEGPFRRYIDGPLRNKLIAWEWTRTEFEFLQHVPWRFTEKVDGTNVRVVWDGHRPQFMGRTSRAQLPTKLLTYLQETFTEELLEQTFQDRPAVLYGEGYGAGIQKGGMYRPDQSFILFDVRIGQVWLAYENVAAIADSLGIRMVPVVAIAPLQTMIWQMSDTTLYSLVGLNESTMEGVVGTPVTPLLNRLGGRIIVKLKAQDIYGLDLTEDLSPVPPDLPMAA